MTEHNLPEPDDAPWLDTSHDGFNFIDEYRKQTEEAEISFSNWFHGDYGPYTFRSEYFYGDCKVEDIKTLEKLMYKWIHAAFVTGFEIGSAQQTKVTPRDEPKG